MERSQLWGTLIGFDTHASRTRGLRRVDSRGSSLARCYAFDVYAARRNAEAARVLTPADIAHERGVLDATDTADVHRIINPWHEGPEVA